MLRNFQDQTYGMVLDLEGIEDKRQFTLIKLHIDDGTNDRLDPTHTLLSNLTRIEI